MSTFSSQSSSSWIIQHSQRSLQLHTVWFITLVSKTKSRFSLRHSVNRKTFRCKKLLKMNTFSSQSSFSWTIQILRGLCNYIRYGSLLILTRLFALKSFFQIMTINCHLPSYFIFNIRNYILVFYYCYSFKNDKTKSIHPP